MIKLHDGGVYLVKGRTLIPEDGQEAAAIQAEANVSITKEEAAANTIATAFLRNIILPGIWKN